MKTRKMNKKAGSGTGAKWFLAITLYFVLSLFIVILVTGITGGTVNTDIGKTVESFCSSPRLIFEPYTTEYEETPSKYEISDLSHLDCSKSQGVISENLCLNISGCQWDTRFNETETCFGQINAIDYEIETYKFFFERLNKVKKHENTEGNTLNFGSICNHPNVIDNQELCYLFSCTWNNYGGLSNIGGIIEFDNLPLTSVGIFSVKHIWATTKELFTFKLDLGLDNEMAQLIMLFMLSWLPLLILILSIYVMVRG